MRYEFLVAKSLWLIINRECGQWLWVPLYEFVVAYDSMFTSFMDDMIASTMGMSEHWRRSKWCLGFFGFVISLRWRSRLLA